jgi:spore maturation protein CgeB
MKQNNMKIIFTSVQHNEYDSGKGESFEYETFYKALSKLSGHTILYVPYDDIITLGKKAWNDRLLEIVQTEKPDLVFAFMYTDELLSQTITAMSQMTKTLAWFSDDHWRLYNYSLRYAKYFTAVVTTYSKAPAIYRAHGVQNVIRSQWAADTSLYNPSLKAEPFHDVAFVGLWSKPRARLIQKLRDAGIAVYVKGRGWKEGSVSQQEMVRIFSSSKINLAINSAPGRFSFDSIGRTFLRKTFKKPGSRKKIFSLESINFLFPRQSLKHIVIDFSLIQNFRSWYCRNILQIKARHFEIPATGGFVITRKADDLETYFENGKEMAIVNSNDELVEKIKYYLLHEDERARIAQAGYERTVREHTYERRLLKVFKEFDSIK